jgi:hypothetical protein
MCCSSTERNSPLDVVNPMRPSDGPAVNGLSSDILDMSYTGRLGEVTDIVGLDVPMPELVKS